MKTRKILRNVILLHFITVWSFVAEAQFTGKLTYSISYETNDSSTRDMIDVLPSESHLYLKGNKLRFNQTIMGGGMQSFIVDKELKSNILLMNFMGQEYKVNMTEDQVSLLEKAQALELKETDKTVVIQGFNCKHVMATTRADTLNIYYTEEISTPSVLPQFASIDGLPLYYQIKKSGIKMTYKCTKVEKVDVDDSQFSIAGSVKEIPFKEFAKNFAISK